MILVASDLSNPDDERLPIDETYCAFQHIRFQMKWIKKMESNKDNANNNNSFLSTTWTVFISRSLQFRQDYNKEKYKATGLL